MVAGVVLFWSVGFLSALEVDAARRMLGLGLLFWAAFAIVEVPEPWHFVLCMAGAVMAYWQFMPLSMEWPQAAGETREDPKPAAEALEARPTSQ